MVHLILKIMPYGHAFRIDRKLVNNIVVLLIKSLKLLKMIRDSIELSFTKIRAFLPRWPCHHANFAHPQKPIVIVLHAHHVTDWCWRGRLALSK